MMSDVYREILIQFLVWIEFCRDKQFSLYKTLNTIIKSMDFSLKEMLQIGKVS